MQNGQANGAAGAPSIQVSAPQAAAFALEFLERASHTRAERERFDLAQALLSGIMSGRISLSNAAPALTAASQDGAANAPPPEGAA